MMYRTFRVVDGAAPESVDASDDRADAVRWARERSAKDVKQDPKWDAGGGAPWVACYGDLTRPCALFYRGEEVTDPEERAGLLGAHYDVESWRYLE